MEEKTGIQTQVEPQYPISKGLAIVAGSVLAIVLSLIFPLGELLLYVFAYLAGRDEKRQSNNQI
ncbi:hypothetical protein ACFP1I_05145 [Dyadobacter subterraneus]|uniref:Uncharacterized protein n=1 Tax=Dyadobacter subterraneus TaxID=2773304 RepID=A0ABR9WG54_9BACT|nr:hypothetical protein [Dyadobacter subterraneus]MBE9464483.1 hypothetical protein [Dyadobacter subterraneus]